MKLLTTLTLTSLLGLSSLMASHYKVDTAHSSIEFKVKHMMVSKTKGTFKTFLGTYDYDVKNHLLSSFEGQASIASVDTQNSTRDKDLVSKKFFDAKTYPNMKLVLIKHSGDTALFNLTIKGVTKQINFEVEDLSDEIKDPWGGFRTGFSLSTKLNRKDFNIAKDTAAMMIGETIKITLEIEGIKDAK